MPFDTYENILKIFADSTDVVIDRQAVVDGGTDKNKWLKDGAGVSHTIAPGEEFKWNYHRGKAFWLTFVEPYQTTYTTTTTYGGYYGNTQVTTTHNGPVINKYHYFTYVLAYAGNTEWMNDKNSEWYKFANGPSEYLNQLAFYGDTDTTSAKSLEAAAVAVTGVIRVMEDWSALFKRWADELNVKGSQLQGTAAGVLKQHLQYFSNEMKIVHDGLVDSNAATNLQNNANTLAQTARKVASAISDWAWRTSSGPARTPILPRTGTQGPGPAQS